MSNTSLLQEREAVTITEAAPLLGVHEITLRRWIKAGKFKARQTQGKKGIYLISTQYINEFLNGNEKTEGR